MQNHQGGDGVLSMNKEVNSPPTSTLSIDRTLRKLRLLQSRYLKHVPPRHRNRFGITLDAAIVEIEAMQEGGGFLLKMLFNQIPGLEGEQGSVVDCPIE